MVDLRAMTRGARRRLAYWTHPVRARFRPRRFHAYCVSAPRSGTLSMAGLLSAYRAAHEPDTRALFDTIRAHAAGRLTATAFREWLERRDRTLWLEMESHNLLNNIPGLLASAFPAAKFVTVIRDCYSWLESYFNLHLTPLPAAVAAQARMVRDWQLGRDRFTHPAEERLLAERGLYTLDGYLSFWAACNSRVLAAIPPHRLLTLRLDELDRRRTDLADFLGASASALDASRAHLHQQERQAGLIFQIDRRHLEERVQRHCGNLMKQYFPEIHSLEDARITAVAPASGR